MLFNGTKRAALDAHGVFAWTLIVIISATFFAPRGAYAIPAFARKYGTSCQTCHLAAPALTRSARRFERTATASREATTRR